MRAPTKKPGFPGFFFDCQANLETITSADILSNSTKSKQSYSLHAVQRQLQTHKKPAGNGFVMVVQICPTVRRLLSCMIKKFLRSSYSASKIKLSNLSNEMANGKSNQRNDRDRT